MAEIFKIIPPMKHPFVLNIKLSSLIETKSELIDFLRKMNIQHSFKQLPGKAIKLNIPIILKQLSKVKPTKIRILPKSKQPEKGSLVSNHEDDEEFVKQRKYTVPESLYLNNSIVPKTSGIFCFIFKIFSTLLK